MGSDTEYAYHQVEPLLQKVGEEDLVLVGGQAVNFWAGVYESRVAELIESAPYTSKDIDFCGDRKAVSACAIRLGGTAVLPALDDATPNSGIIILADRAGTPLTIDVVQSPFGLAANEVFRTSLRVEILRDDGESTGNAFRVMHPVLLLESRVHNVMGLPGGDSPRGRKQLRAMVLCAREFLQDRLDDGLVRPVLGLNERIFHFCCEDLHGRQIAARTGIDPFDAVLVDDRLPAAFRQRRYPQMQQALKRVRSRIGA